MKTWLSVEQLADEANQWCDQHQIVPASGQTGERITERGIRYYRTLGLVDPPAVGGGQGFGEKHRLQLIAIRLLQAQGLPLNRIRELLFGRTLDELKRIEKQGLAEAKEAPVAMFRPAGGESWGVTPLDDEFLLISRRGRTLPPELRAPILNLLSPEPVNHRRMNGAKRKIEHA